MITISEYITTSYESSTIRNSVTSLYFSNKNSHWPVQIVRYCSNNTTKPASSSSCIEKLTQPSSIGFYLSVWKCSYYANSIR